MGMVTKTASEIIAIANSAHENRKKTSFDYADIDTSEMPELTAGQLARMQPARIFERLPEQL